MLDLDLLAAVVACCSHDYDHPGYNNNFQIRTESETALLYNDQSVLEMHHCTLAFRVMQREHCNFTEDWDWDTKKVHSLTLSHSLCVIVYGIVAALPSLSCEIAHKHTHTHTHTPACRPSATSSSAPFWPRTWPSTLTLSVASSRGS